jgi:hypothetical protein
MKPSVRHRLYYSVGVLLVVAAVAGLIISGAGTVGVWRLERAVVTGMETNFGLLDTTLQTTVDGLTVAEEALDQADAALSSLVATIETSGKSISDTEPLMETLAQVTTEDLPETISTTQIALESAQSSARVIDSTLTVLTSLPLLPVERYAPRVPLNEALEEVVTSLDTIPATLESMEGALTTTAGNLNTLEGQFAEIATSVAAINTSLSAARVVVTQYQQVVGSLQQQVASARVSLPRQVTALAGS